MQRTGELALTRSAFTFDEQGVPAPKGLELLRLGGANDLGERRGVDDRELAQDLAIEADVRVLEAVDEAGVARAVDASAGVDAGDPKTAEVALLEAAMGVGVNPRLHHHFF